MTKRPRKNPVNASLEEIVTTLEAEIIFGRMSPRQELVEDVLMERFGTKRHIIRAALQELIQRGSVEKERGHSARVRSIPPVEVNEIYQMRELLHREAVRVMPLPGAPRDVAELREIDAAYVAAIDENREALAIHQLNDRFHEKLFGLCRNTLLCEMIHMLNLRSAPIRSHGIVDPEWLTQARREHAQMIEAVEKGEREALSRLVVEHMQPTRQIWERMHSVHKQEAGS